ncbi:MAG: baseplate J/gp47 family protein [Myxococcales bacterium]|jgi:uncharacterized phage protein gp47/JayE
MAFTRPTLAEIVTRVQADLVSRLSLVTPILRRSVVYVLARVIAGAVHMLYGYLEYLSKQVFPDRSDDSFLIRQAALFGLSKRAAEYAIGNVTITGKEGAIIPAGSVLQRADGIEYATDSEATLVATTIDVAVTAIAAGADGNCDAGTELSFQSPIADVQSTAVVGASGLTNGSDEETTDSLRDRLLERMQSPPHGGNAADYIAWAKEVSGVTRAWVYPLEDGPGTVTVRFVRDDDASLIPDAAEVAAVQDYIDALAPVTADVTVSAPVAKAIDYVIHVSPDTSAVRAAVEAELIDLLRRDAEPGGIILLSRIRNAIHDAAGVTDYVLTAPAADVTNETGEIAVHGTITWS